MDKIVNELKKQFSFKETTEPGDIVILASDEPRMIVYAMVTDIEPDPGRKRSWWNVTMQVLTVPPAKVVWTLREPQFTGKENFSLGGVEHFMKAVRFATAPSGPVPSGSGKPGSTYGPSRGKLRVIK